MQVEISNGAEILLCLRGRWPAKCDRHLLLPDIVLRGRQGRNLCHPQHIRVFGRPLFSPTAREQTGALEVAGKGEMVST